MDRRQLFFRAPLSLIFFAATPLFAATFTVTNNNDAGAGSLRQAMSDANASGGADQIIWSGTGGVISLNTPLPAVSEDLDIDGSGATAAVFLSGPNGFSIASGVVTLRNLQLMGNPLIKTGAGLLGLSSTNLYTGGTELDAGTLRIRADDNLGVSQEALRFDGGTLQAAADLSLSRAIDINTDGGTIDTNGFGAVLFGDITGSGLLTKTGGGRLELLAANQRTGGLLIQDGIVRGDVNSLSGPITNNATLELNQATDASYVANVSGTGSFHKLGGGLVGVSGTLTQTNIFLEQGAMLIGSQDVLAQTQFVNVGENAVLATLVPDARVQRLSNQGAMVLAPGTLHAASYSGGGSFYTLLAGPASNGRLDVVGVADLHDGVVVPLFTGGFLPSGTAEFTILTAAGLSGQFADLQVPAGFSGDLIYSDTDVKLLLRPVALEITIGNENQRGVAAAVDTMRASPTGDWANVVGVINTLNENDLHTALDRMTPMSLASMTDGTLLATRSYLDGMRQRFSAIIRGDGTDNSAFAFYRATDEEKTQPVLLAEAGAADTDRKFLSTNPLRGWRFFAALNGNTGRVDGKDSGAGPEPGFDFNGLGVTVGGDRPLTDAVAIGGSLNYGVADQDVEDSRGHISADTLRASAYSVYRAENGIFINSLIGLGKLWYDTNRRVQFGEIDRHSEGSPDGIEFHGLVEGEKLFVAGKARLAPVAGLYGSRVKVDGFTENAGGAVDLSVGEQKATSFRSSLRLELTRPVEKKSGGFYPLAFVGWEHEFEDDARSINAQFSSGGAPGFSVQTAAPARDSAILGAGVDALVSSSFHLNLRYAGEFNSDVRAHTLELGARLAF